MKIKNLMTRDLVTLSPLTEVASAARVLVEKGISGAPVVDDNGELLGVVSQTDLTRFQSVAAPSVEGWKGAGADWDVERLATPIVAVMTDKPITCDEEASVGEVAVLMRQRHIHRVIVTCQGKISGIVTAMDLLKAVPNE